MLYYLRDHREATLTELAGAVSERDENLLPPQPSNDHLNRFRISLAHTHLPKLVESGWVRYDPSSRTARYAPQTDRHDLLLSDIDRFETSFVA